MICNWMSIKSLPDRPEQSCGFWEFVALLYLSLPLLLFFAFFTKVWIAVPALATIVVVMNRVRPRSGHENVFAGGPDTRLLFICGAISALFLWVCGYAGPFGRTFDWVKHFAILNELAQQPWPPINDETHTFLRYSLGYYLLPGIFTALFGIHWIEWFVFLQTWTGLFLLLALLLQKIRPPRPTLFVALFLLFSGLDLIGWLMYGRESSILAHKEWWTSSNFAFAYEGHATIFIWVPQHALAGMIGLALLLPGQAQGPCTQYLGLLGAAVLLWSPFAAIGLAPFALASALRIGWKALLDWGNIICALLLGIPLAGYLMAGAAGVPHGFNWDHPGFSWATYTKFITLEVGMYLLALRVCGWQHLRHRAIVIVMLLLLPLYRIGAFNDFTMRACIPAIMLIAIAASSVTVEARELRCLPLVILMLVGCITSVLEIVGRGRDGTVSAPAQTLRSGVLAQAPYFIQYNAPLPNWVLRSYLCPDPRHWVANVIWRLAHDVDDRGTGTREPAADLSRCRLL
jgi:hypothetical protein